MLDPSSVDLTFTYRTGLIAKRRCQNWPEDFSSKGYVLASRRHKGSPYKIQDEEGVWRYAIATGRYQLHGAEGSGLRAVREGEWSADKGLGDEALTQNDSSVKFRGVVKEDMEEIEAGLIRTKKRKMKRSLLPLGSAPLPSLAGPKTRSGAIKSIKPAKSTRLSSPTKARPTKSTGKSAGPTRPTINPIDLTKSAMPKNFPEPKKGKGTKRVRADETEDSQATLKNESGSDALRKKRKVVSKKTRLSTSNC